MSTNHENKVEVQNFVPGDSQVVYRKFLRKYRYNRQDGRLAITVFQTPRDKLSIFKWRHGTRKLALLHQKYKMRKSGCASVLPFTCTYAWDSNT